MAPRRVLSTGPGATAHSRSDESAIERIEGLELVLRRACALQAWAVAAMRDEGASWSEIEQCTDWPCADLEALADRASHKRVGSR